MISEKLAEKMGLGMKKKMVLTFQTTTESFTKPFRVSGIYRTLNAAWDELNIYVQQKDVERIIGTSLIHEVLISYDKSEDTERKRLRLVQMLHCLLSSLLKQNSPNLALPTI